MILRGGAEQFIEETERSLHDAIMIVRRAIKNDSVVAGQCSKYTNCKSKLLAKSLWTTYVVRGKIVFSQESGQVIHEGGGGVRSFFFT